MSNYEFFGTTINSYREQSAEKIIRYSFLKFQICEFQIYLLVISFALRKIYENSRILNVIHGSISPPSPPKDGKVVRRWAMDFGRCAIDLAMEDGSGNRLWTWPWAMDRPPITQRLVHHFGSVQFNRLAHRRLPSSSSTVRTIARLVHAHRPVHLPSPDPSPTGLIGGRAMGERRWSKIEQDDGVGWGQKSTPV